MHARVSGLADFLAVDEIDAIRIGREIVGEAELAQVRPRPDDARPTSRVYDPESCSASRRLTCGSRSIRER